MDEYYPTAPKRGGKSVLLHSSRAVFADGGCQLYANTGNSSKCSFLTKRVAQWSSSHPDRKGLLWSENNRRKILVNE
jgi:hypothetical protein